MKRIIAGFMLIVSLIIFCGCAKVSYSVKINTDGSMEQSVTVDLDEQAILDAGYTTSELTTIKSAIVQKMNLYAIALNNRFKTYTEVPVEVIERIEEINTFRVLPNVDSSIIEIKLVFACYSDYAYFYSGKPEIDGDDPIVDDKLFYYLENNYSTTIFKDIEDDPNFEDFVDYFNMKGIFSVADIDFTYNYGTPYEKVYSDADEYNYLDGVTIHSWHMEGDRESRNRVINIYTVGFNQTLWYVTALVLVGGFILVSFIYLGVTKRKKKLENNETEINM